VTSSAPPAGWYGDPDGRSADAPSLPFGATGLAALGLFGGFIAATIVSVTLVFGFGVRSTSPAVTVANLLALWTGLLGAGVAASRRYGTGNLGADLGLHWEWIDAARGVAANVTARLVTTAVAVPLVAAGAAASNTTIIQNQKASTIGLIIVGVSAVIGAPIVEELFFRGLLLRSLASRLEWRRAVAVQGLVFGLAHSNPALGWRTLTIVIITATFGICQGAFARRWSLGPLMVSHGLFNLVPFLIVSLR